MSSAVQNEKNVSANDFVVIGYSAQKEPQKKAAIATPSPSAESGKDDVFQVVEQMPKYPGGNQAMFKYLGENIKYPAKAQQDGIQGRVICSFIVNVDGSIADTKIVRGIEPNLDAEAIRVINAMPNWEPGMQRGNLVRVKYTLPINFQLSGEKAQRNENPLNAVKLNKPLIILDGVTQPAEFDLNKINPNNIDNIEVFKEASATDKYGESGKNGVIKITSKK